MPHHRETQTGADEDGIRDSLRYRRSPCVNTTAHARFTLGPPVPACTVAATVPLSPGRVDIYDARYAYGVTPTS